ncbi:MAG: hypothetical protein IJJ26_12475 [Victivallales bacterium]|nr:hypothetical protein [Victivallales bacterium]
MIHLPFHHRGKQFFFLTFCLKGRPKVLSNIVEEEEHGRHHVIATPTPLGAVVLEEWARQHSWNPALIPSARIVMPDHAHFLLIIDFDRCPQFDLLDWIHHFRRNIEEQWRILGNHSICWEDSFWLELSFDSRQLQAIRRYIRLNPARYLWKLKHSDCFLRQSDVHARVLEANRQWDAMGELTLLGNPFLFHVRLTLKKTVEEHQNAIADILDKARMGMIPVSGFISPGEKELLRRLKMEPNTRFIKMLPYALPPRYDPSTEDSRELAAHRLLILSGFPQTVQNDGHAFRRNCLQMNDLAAEICRRAREPIN